MKIVVVYKSKTGFTKTYAEWIANELNCDIKENNKLRIEDINSYDTIIYGGGLYAGGVDGLQLLTDNFATLQQKNLIVWATGCSPGRQEEIDAVWSKHFTGEQLKHIKTFYLRGGFDYSKLSKGNKLIMKMFKWKLKNDKNPTEDAKGMLHAYEEPEDHRDKKNIEPLIAYVKEIR